MIRTNQTPAGTATGADASDVPADRYGHLAHRSAASVVRLDVSLALHGSYVASMKRPAVLLASCALAAACGSTVPASQLQSVASNSLGTAGSQVQAGPPSTSSAAPAAGSTSVGRTPSWSTGGQGASTAGGMVGTARGAIAPATGTRRDTTPVKVGFEVLKGGNAAVSSAFGTPVNFGDGKAEITAIVNDVNAHGGIAGRKLEAVEFTQKPTSNDYANDMQAACARFTQDNKVSVVLRAVLGGVTPENYEGCLTNAGVISLEMSYAVGDNTMLRRHPLMYNVSAPSADRRERAVLTGLARSGYLSSKNTIGVLVEECPESQRAYQNTVVPLARSLGLRITMRTVGCLTGFSGVGAFSAQVQSAVLPFRSAGVDRVTFVSVWEPLALLFFETAAAHQGWHPAYALSSNAAIGSTVGEYSNEQLSRMRGIGWAPNSDTGKPPANATSKQCEAMARSQGVTPQTPGDVGLLRLVCDLFLVYKTAVESAGGRDDPVSLAAGLASASRTYLSAAVLGGRLRLGQGAQNAPTQVAEFAFATSCSCFTYVSRPRPLP